MSELLSSRTKELQAMSTEKLNVAVGLLTGHTTLRAHMFKSVAGLPTVRGQKRR
jgi:hypothetical protein